MGKGHLPRAQWPECLHGHPKLKGVFVGGCVKRGVGSSFHAKAHAHTSGSAQGWICVRKAERLHDRMLMLHELAHILTEDGHTDRWRARLLELGGTLDPTDSLKSYQKRRREVAAARGVTLYPCVGMCGAQLPRGRSCLKCGQGVPSLRCECSGSHTKTCPTFGWLKAPRGESGA